MHPAALLKAAFIQLLTGVYHAQFDKNDAVVGVCEASRTNIMQQAVRSFKLIERLQRKQDTHPGKERFLQRMWKRVEINRRLLAFFSAMSDSKQLSTFLDINSVFTWQGLYRVPPAQLNGIAEVPIIDRFCGEIENLLPGVLTGMKNNAENRRLYPQGPREYTEAHFGIPMAGLRRTSRQELLQAYGGFSLPHLVNPGHDCSVIVAVRLFASMGAPFRQMVEDSLAGVSRTQTLNPAKRDKLQALLDLLNNTRTNPHLLRRLLFPDKKVNSDLDVIMVVLRIVECLNEDSQNRLKSFVDQVLECPNKECRPPCGGDYQTLNYVSTSSGVWVYVWSTPDFGYNDEHDVYQKALKDDFHQPDSCRFACSFRSLGYARMGKIKNCSNTQCYIKDKNPGVQCKVKERLRKPKAVTAHPRWQLIQTKVVPPHPTLKPTNDANHPSFKALKVKPHPTLNLHSFYEAPNGNAQAEPSWNDHNTMPYKLLGYVVLSRKTYNHVAWRQSFTFGGQPYFLHVDDQYVYFISRAEYEKEDQAIMLLVYEEVPEEAEEPTQSTSGRRMPTPPHKKPGAPGRNRWI